MSSSHKRNNIPWATITLVAQLFLLAFIAGVGSWFTKGFDPKYIGSPEWWADTSTQITYNYLTLFSVFQYRINRIRKIDLEYIAYHKRVDSAASTIHPDSLNRWLLKFNTERIIQSHINFYQYLLDKNEKKRGKQKNILVWEKGTKEKQDKNRYCKKKKKYLNYLSKEYIEENRYIIRAKKFSGIRTIKSSFITKGYNNGPRLGDNWNIQRSGSKFIKDLLPKTIMTTLVVVLIRSIILDVAEVDNIFLMIVNTLLILVPMVMHGNVGWNYAEQFHREKDEVDLRKREELIALHNKETRVGENNGV